VRWQVAFSTAKLALSVSPLSFFPQMPRSKLSKVLCTGKPSPVRILGDLRILTVGRLRQEDLEFKTSLG
jgi:hypothetical protein